MDWLRWRTKSAMPPGYLKTTFLCSSLALRPLVLEADLEALVQEGVGLQALDDGLGPELDALARRTRCASGQNVIVEPRAAAGRRTDLLELADGLAAVLERHPVALAALVDLGDELRGQGVDDGDADAVEAAGDLVAAPAELPAGVEHGHDDLEGALPLVLALGVGLEGDAAAVVDDPAAAVGQQGDVDAVALAGHGLVDGVVDDLPDEVVEAGEAGRADVHAGPASDGLEALQHVDVLGAVRAVRPGLGRLLAAASSGVPATCCATGATSRSGSRNGAVYSQVSRGADDPNCNGGIVPEEVRLVDASRRLGKAAVSPSAARRRPGCRSDPRPPLRRPL